MKLIEELPEDLLNSVNSFSRELEKSSRLPVYSYHKWWARRYSGIIRLFLLFCELDRNIIKNIQDYDEFVRDTYHSPPVEVNSKVLLDPFAGGGTVIFEGSKIGYESVGIEINKLACDILSVPTFFSKAESMKGKILDFADQTNDLWQTKCKDCGHSATIIHTFLYWADTNGNPQVKYNEVKRGYKNGQATYYCESCDTVFKDQAKLKECPYCKNKFNKEYKDIDYHHIIPYAVEYICSHCKKRKIKKASKKDKERFFLSYKCDLPNIPTLNETKRLLNHGFKRFDELLTQRQLWTFMNFLKKFMNTEYEQLSKIMVSDSLRCCSYLAWFSPKYRKVIPGFVIRSYWLPAQPVELNPLSFRFTSDNELFPQGRGNMISVYRRILKAKNWSAKVGYDFNEIEIKSGASQDILNNISRKVDIVFTDPPYADFQYYSDLSLFATSLITHYDDNFSFRKYVDELIDKEIVARDQSEGFRKYIKNLSSVFSKIKQHLRLGSILLMTFHHSDKDVMMKVLKIFKTLSFSLIAIYPVIGESPNNLGSRKLYLDLLFVFKNTSQAKQHDIFTVPTSIYRSQYDLDLINSISDIIKYYTKNGS